MFKLMFSFLFSVFLFAEGLIPENVVICGICKDGGDRLHYSMKIMEDIGSMFKDYRIVVYENNSVDATKKRLKKWAKSNSKVLVKMEDLTKREMELIAINHSEQNKISRFELIARARNIVLDEVMSDQYKDFIYVLWMDMDFKLSPSLAGIAEVFNSNQDWDAVFAYGVSPDNEYWDWYAFRDYYSYPLGRELLGDAWWHGPKTFNLSQSDPWYPVSSAFGGFGIYKKSSILGCRYSASVTEDLEVVSKKIIEQGVLRGNVPILTYLENLKKLNRIVKIDQSIGGLQKIYDENVGIVLNEDLDRLVWRMNCFMYEYPSTCEHVSFHASMIAKGHDKLFINPRMLFFYGDRKPALK